MFFIEWPRLSIVVKVPTKPQIQVTNSTNISYLSWKGLEPLGVGAGLNISCHRLISFWVESDTTTNGRKSKNITTTLTPNLICVKLTFFCVIIIIDKNQQDQVKYTKKLWTNKEKNLNIINLSNKFHISNGFSSNLIIIFFHHFSFFFFFPYIWF